MFTYKKMTFLLVLTFFLCTTSIRVSAQLFVNGRNVNAMDSVQVIELTTLDNNRYNMSPKRNWYSVDYGQINYEENRWEYRVTDSTNIIVRFTNTIAVVNHIISKGWTILSVNNYDIYTSNTGDDGTVYYKYTFIRKPSVKVE